MGVSTCVILCPSHVLHFIAPWVSPVMRVVRECLILPPVILDHSISSAVSLVGVMTVARGSVLSVMYWWSMVMILWLLSVPVMVMMMTVRLLPLPVH